MADDVIGSLRVNVAADLSDLQEELGKVPAIVAESISSISSAGNVSSESFEEFAARMKGAATEAGAELKQMGSGVTEVGTKAAEAAPGLHEFQEAAAGISEGIVGLLEKLGVAVTVFEILKESFEAFSEAQNITTSFTLLSGSADVATASMEHLKEMANQLAVSEGTILEQASKLAPQFGVGTKALYDVLQAAGDAAAGANRSFDAVAQSIDRIAISGQVGARQLKELGISIEDIAAQMGVSAAAAKQMMADTAEGALSATEKVQIILDTIESRFPGAAEALSKNLSGQFNVLKNELHQLAEDLGTALAPLATDLIAGLEQITPTLKGIALGIAPAAQGFKELATAVGALVPDFLKIIFSGPAMVALGTAIGYTAQAGKLLVDVLHAAVLETADFVSALNPFGNGLKQLQEDFKQAGIAIDKDIAGFGDITKSGLAAADALIKVSNANEVAAPKATAHATATNTLSQALKDAEANLSEVNKAFQLGVANHDDLAAAQGRVVAAMQAMHPELKSIFTETQDANAMWANSRGMILGLGQDLLDLAPKLSAHTALLMSQNVSLQARAGLWSRDMQDLQDDSAALSDNSDELYQNYLKSTDVNDILKHGADIISAHNTQIRNSTVDMKGFDAVQKMVDAGIKEELKSIQQLSTAIGSPLHDAFILGINDGRELKVRMGEVHEAFVRATQAVDDQGRAVYSEHQLMIAQLADYRAQIQLGQALGQNTDELQIKYMHLADAIRTQNVGFTDTVVQMHNVMNSGFQNALDDLIFKTGDVGKAFKQMGENLVETFANRILNDALKPVLNALDSIIDKALKAVENVLKIGSSASSPMGQIAGVGGIPGVYTPGIGDIPGIGGSAGSAAGGASSAVSGVSSAIGASIAPLFGMVTGAVSAVTGVISVFQNMHQETSLNAIESNTRVGALYTLALLEQTQGIDHYNYNSQYPVLFGIDQAVTALAQGGIGVQMAALLAPKGPDYSEYNADTLSLVHADLLDVKSILWGQIHDDMVSIENKLDVINETLSSGGLGNTGTFAVNGVTQTVTKVGQPIAFGPEQPVNAPSFSDVVNGLARAAPWQSFVDAMSQSTSMIDANIGMTNDWLHALMHGIDVTNSWLAAIAQDILRSVPTFNINIAGNVIGNQEFLEQLKAAIADELRTQGVYA